MYWIWLSSYTVTIRLRENRNLEHRKKKKVDKTQLIGGRTAHKAIAEITLPNPKGTRKFFTGILNNALVSNTSVSVEPTKMNIIIKEILTVVKAELRIKVDTNAITFPVRAIKKALE